MKKWCITIITALSTFALIGSIALDSNSIAISRNEVAKAEDAYECPVWSCFEWVAGYKYATVVPALLQGLSWVIWNVLKGTIKEKVLLCERKDFDDYFVRGKGDLCLSDAVTIQTADECKWAGHDLGLFNNPLSTTHWGQRVGSAGYPGGCWIHTEANKMFFKDTTKDNNAANPAAQPICRNFQEVTCCEGSHCQLTCPADHIIHIRTAVFGRWEVGAVRCPHKKSDVPANGCALDVREKIARKCERGCKSTTCKVGASKSLGDPCGGTFKYLQIKWSCVGVRYHLAPEGSFKCDHGVTATQSECKAAARSLSPSFGRQMAVGSGGSCMDGGWGQVPRGCSVQTGGDGTAHYKTSGDTGDGCIHQHYQLVCTKDYDSNLKVFLNKKKDSTNEVEMLDGAQKQTTKDLDEVESLIEQVIEEELLD